MKLLIVQALICATLSACGALTISSQRMPTTSETCRRAATKIVRYSKLGEMPEGGRRELGVAFNEVVACYVELDLALECRKEEGCEKLKDRYNATR